MLFEEIHTPIVVTYSFSVIILYENLYTIFVISPNKTMVKMCHVCCCSSHLIGGYWSIFCPGGSGYGTDRWKKGISDKFGRKVDGATISIKQDGKAFKTVTTASNGKYEDVTMPYDHVYEITISKGGFVKSYDHRWKEGLFSEDVKEKKGNYFCRKWSRKNQVRLLDNYQCARCKSKN